MDLGKIVIFDVDGTLAITNHRQHHIDKVPKDWDSYFSELDKDPPNRSVVVMYQMFAEAGYRNVILTGRPERTRQATEQWLLVNGVDSDPALFMRPEGDHRPDDEVKPMLLEIVKAIWPNEKIALAIDDRPSIIRVWWEKGIPVIPIYNPEWQGHPEES